MSVACLRWGAGLEFNARSEYRGTPYTDKVAGEQHLWFVVDDESQIVGEIRLAGRRWRLAEVYTTTLYWLVYERVGGPPRSSCGSGRFT